jgi:DNA-binding response OmpR family regulator
MRAGILEDDPVQLEQICSILEKQGFVCHGFQSAQEILSSTRRDSYDLLIIDWGLPERSGLEVLIELRTRNVTPVPVIFLTNRDREEDIITALNAGADDFMIKPTRAGEMIARVNAVLRRAMHGRAADSMLEVDEFHFDLRAKSATSAGAAIDLTSKEFDLAVLFLRSIGRPLSRSHIREQVWGRDVAVPSRTMDTHVSRVRTKLNLRPESGYLLAPVYSYGYRLEKVTATVGAEAK